MKKSIDVILMLIVVLFFVAITLESKRSPLNVRNNNPCNIKYSKSNKWLGSSYDVGIFEKFKDKRHGLRACLSVITTNIVKTNSVEEFVLRFATEGHETIKSNNIKNYRDYLIKKLKYVHKINIYDSVKVMQYVIYLEGGRDAIIYYKDIKDEN